MSVVVLPLTSKTHSLRVQGAVHRRPREVKIP